MGADHGWGLKDLITWSDEIDIPDFLGSDSMSRCDQCHRKVVGLFSVLALSHWADWRVIRLQVVIARQEGAGWVHRSWRRWWWYYLVIMDTP